MCLHYLKNLHFCENSNAGKVKIKKFTGLTLILLIEKDATFWLWHNVMANLIRKIYQTLSELASFCKRDKNILVFFRFTVLTAVHLQTRMLSFTRWAETLFRWGGRHLHFRTTNLVRTICTKFYHNRSGFVDCRSKKTFWCVFWVHRVVK